MVLTILNTGAYLCVCGGGGGGEKTIQGGGGREYRSISMGARKPHGRGRTINQPHNPILIVEPITEGSSANNSALSTIEYVYILRGDLECNQFPCPRPLSVSEKLPV